MCSGDYYAYLLTAIRDNVLPLTSRCNTACVFCSHRQNPADVITFRLSPLPVPRLLELARFLDPHRRIVIGESATRLDEGEPFTHPEIIPILRGIRRMFPHTEMALTTNGTLLTRAVVQTLAALGPLEVTVSLNSVTPAGRRALMNDREPERALAAVQALCAAGIPFNGSLVAMPHLVGWHDMEETVSFLAENQARTIRVFLPGYTDRAEDKLRFPLHMWDAVTEWARQCTRESDLPVIPEPAVPSDTAPAVWGVMRNSPAKSAGLQAGDVILAADGRQMRTRVEAFLTCKRTENPVLSIQRGSRVIPAALEKKRGESPGFVVLYDFDPIRAQGVAAEIVRHRSVSPLLLASEFGHTMVQTALSMFCAAPVTVISVKNRFFGGSIKAAGLLTVEDFHRAASESAALPASDLILVPREAFDHRNTDLRGKSLEQLSAMLSLPIAAV